MSQSNGVEINILSISTPFCSKKLPFRSKSVWRQEIKKIHNYDKIGNSDFCEKTHKVNFKFLKKKRGHVCVNKESM